MYNRTLTPKIAAGALSDPVDYHDGVMGLLVTPASLAATTKIAFKVCDTKNGTYVDLRQLGSDARVELVVDLAASHVYPLPSELSRAPFFKIWTENGAGVDVANAGAQFKVILKG